MPGGLFSPPAGDVAFGVGGGSFAPPATVGAPLTPLAISREFFENKVRVDVEWDGASTDKVAVTGAFIGWAAPGMSLTYMDGRWTGSVFIEKGAFPAHIKFIVHGVWRTSSNMDVITDGAGNVNNLVHPPYAFPNWVGYWHITNPESPYCAPGAHPPEYAAMEALEDEDAMMRRFCSVAGFAFDKRMRTADRLRLIRDRLCTSSAAYIDACQQAFVPWLADAAIEGVGDVLVHPVRSYVVTAKAPPPELIADMDAADRTLSTVRKRTGDLEYQPNCAYDKGFLYTLDESKYDAMVLEAAAGDDPDVYVPAIPFAMLAWQQGHLHLALLLFGLAFPGHIVRWGQFVGGRAWLTVIGPDGEPICIILIVVSVYRPGTLIAAHPQSTSQGVSNLLVGVYEGFAGHLSFGEGHTLQKAAAGKIGGSASLGVPKGGAAELADRGGRDVARGRMMQTLRDRVNRAKTPEAREAAVAAHQAALL